MGKKLFEKGNPGKQKGVIPKVNKQAKELFVGIMEGQTGKIEEALNDVFKKDKKGYLEVLAKFYPFFMPKKTEHSGSLETTGGLNLTVVKRVTTTPQIKDDEK